MKKIILLFSVILLVACSFIESLEGKLQPLKKTKVSEWLYHLCSYEFAGRKTGSVGDSLAFEFIKDKIHSFGYEYEVQNFTTTNGYRLRNICVPVQGEDDSLLIIGAHYDGAMETDGVIHYPAANDNASGVVVNMALLDTLQKMAVKPQHTVIVCFWDGEEVFDGSCFWGSMHYVSTLKDKSIVLCYLNFDSIGHEHGVLYLRHIKGSNVEKYLNIIYKNSYFDCVDIEMESISGGGTDYVPFGMAGIPFIGFGDHNGNMCDARSHSMADIVECMSLDRLDRHILNLLDLIY